MKVLFIGGTGMISAAASRMAISRGFELYLLNRGSRVADMPGSRHLAADIRRPEDVRAVLQGLDFDVVVDWIAYTADDVERDIGLFRGRTEQYVFISSASAYQKPPDHYLISESTPLHNPFWEYARDKIACERRLMRAHRDEGFPATIVRPSMTYDTNLPIALGGWGTYTLADRLLKGLPIIVHGDGSSLWVVTHADDLARGLAGPAGQRAGRGRGVPHHVRRGAHLEPDLPAASPRRWAWRRRSCTSLPISSRAWRRRWPGVCWATRRGASCSTTARSRSSCLASQATITFREGIRRTLDWFAADERRRRVDEAVHAEMDRILSAYAGAAT